MPKHPVGRRFAMVCRRAWVAVANDFALMVISIFQPRPFAATINHCFGYATNNIRSAKLRSRLENVILIQLLDLPASESDPVCLLRSCACRPMCRFWDAGIVVRPAAGTATLSGRSESALRRDMNDAIRDPAGGPSAGSAATGKRCCRRTRRWQPWSRRP
jgi:hypothetical protein